VSVVCSRFESFSYTVTEAMALGCPIVAARVAAIPEVVRDGINGLLHRSGDAGDLAEKILTLLRNPGQAAALGRRAGEDAERSFHPDSVAKKLLMLYERAVERWPGPRRSIR
jgi:glycosyltransferase involved in cell wall biosynthesis